MKKTLQLLLLLFGCALAAQAQGDIKFAGTNPLGTACGGYTFALYQGTLYSCQAGVFAAMPTKPSGNANFVLYPSANPNGNVCSVTNNIDPLAQVFSGSVYTCQGGFYTAVTGGAGGGNVSNSGTPTAGQWGVWVTATTIKGVTVSGDCAFSALGVVTCTKTNNVAFATSATTDTTNATNITTGTIAAAILNPSVAAHTVLGNNTGLSAAAAFLRLACADLSNAAASCSTDATNASNIGSGTLNNAQLPSAISVTTLTASGAVTGSSFVGTSAGGVGNNWLAVEGTDPGTELAGKDLLYADSSAHKILMSLNGSAAAGNALLGANQVNTAGSSMTLDMHSASSLVGWKPPAAAGAVPTAQGACSYDTTSNTMVCGDGTNTRHGEVIVFTGTFSNTTAASTCITGARCYAQIFSKTGALVTTEPGLEEPIGIAATMTKLCVRISGTQPAVTTTIALRDVTTLTTSALALAITSGQTAGQYCATGSVAVNSTDDYDLEIFNSTGTASAAMQGIVLSGVQ